MKKRVSVDVLDSHLMRIKIHYENDFPDKDICELNKVMDCIDSRKRRNNTINISKLEQIVKSHWTDLILEAIDDLLSTIHNRKSRGAEFAEIVFDLKKAHDDFTYNKTKLEIETLRDTYENELLRTRAKVEEKIKIEKYNIKVFSIGLLIGSILGVAASYIAGQIPTL